MSLDELRAMFMSDIEMLDSLDNLILDDDDDDDDAHEHLHDPFGDLDDEDELLMMGWLYEERQREQQARDHMHRMMRYTTSLEDALGFGGAGAGTGSGAGAGAGAGSAVGPDAVPLVPPLRLHGLSGLSSVAPSAQHHRGQVLHGPRPISVFGTSECVPFDDELARLLMRCLCSPEMLQLLTDVISSIPGRADPG